MTLGERIKELRESKNWKQTELANKLGVSQPTIAEWESGIHEIGPTNRKKICELFGITPNELYGIALKKEPLPVQRIPVISWVHANKFEEISPVEISNEYIYSDIKGEKIFALRVVNDCMSPEFNEGDIIVIHPGLHIDHDNFIVVADHEANTATFKQIKIYGTKRILHPLNPKYKDIELNHNKRYHIVGKVIAKQRKY